MRLDRDRSCLRAAEGWVLADLSRPPSARYAARALGLSRRALDRQCRRELGLPIAVWLRELRLHQIQWRVDVQRVYLAEAACGAGYRRRRRFLRDFERLFGTVPETWRFECSFIGRWCTWFERSCLSGADWQWA